jgi:sulfate adenylyltransferase subunit 1
MDLVDYKEEVYQQIRNDFDAFAAGLEIVDIHFIPISALLGDNVVERSQHMPWYEGQTLISVLETTHIGSDQNLTDTRFPVQYVIRPQTSEHHDYRGYAGRIAGGVFKTGDPIKVLPGGLTSRIKSLDTQEGSLTEAFAPMSIAMTLADEIDISRGDMIVGENETPQVSQDIDLMVCWMGEKKLTLNHKYAVRHTTREVRCVVKDIKYKLNISNLEKIRDDQNVNMNDIARITIRTTHPLVFDPYNRNRITGSLILIDEGTNTTVGAGMIVQSPSAADANQANRPDLDYAI